MPNTKPVNPPREFEGNRPAFDYACKHMDCTLRKNSILPAIIMDAKEYAGVSAPVKRDENGIQTALLKVASDDGGFLVTAQTPNADVEDLKPGDLVAWHAFEFINAIARQAEDNRFGWIGTIVAKLKPEIDATNGWRIEKKFI